MKKKLLLLVVLFALFALFIVVKLFVLDRKPDSGSLRVLSSPQAKVFIDNKSAGKTPFETNISVGEHTLKLIPEVESAETTAWTGKITVSQRCIVWINASFPIHDFMRCYLIPYLTPLRNKTNKASSFSVIYYSSQYTNLNYDRV